MEMAEAEQTLAELEQKKAAIGDLAADAVQFLTFTIDDADFDFMEHCADNGDLNATVADILSKTDFSLDQVRSLVAKQLVILTK